MDQIPQDGVLLEDRPPGGNNTFVVRNPDGLWPTPGAEHQRSLVDSMACVSYSAVHCIESQIEKLTGTMPNFSERFLAKMSNTTQNGNWQTTVFSTIKQFGLVDDALWPEPAQFDWNSYYSEVPQAVIDKGQDFLKKWNVEAKWVSADEVDAALKEAPLQAVISAENPTHAVMTFTRGQYFDTYDPFIKPLNTVHDYLEIVVTPKEQPMNLYVQTMNYSGTVGIFIPLSNPDQVALINNIYNTNIVVEHDGSIKTDKIVKDA